jgi:hypothetical protein
MASFLLLANIFVCGNVQNIQFLSFALIYLEIGHCAVVESYMGAAVSLQTKQ